MGLNSASLTVTAQANQTFSQGTQTIDNLNARKPTVNSVLPFNGTNPYTATLLYSGKRTTGASETIDLTSTLKDEQGTTIDFSTAKIKVIVVVNLDTTAGHVLKLGAAAATQWANYGTAANLGPFSGTADIAVVGAGGVWVASSPVDGYGVDATHKSLKVDAGANTLNYLLMLWG